MSTDRNIGSGNPSAERSDDEKILLVQELTEALTAVGNYLAAANRMIGGESPPAQHSLAEALEKSVGQCERAGSAVRRLRLLLLGESRTDDGG